MHSIKRLTQFSMLISFGLNRLMQYFIQLKHSHNEVNKTKRLRKNKSAMKLCTIFILVMSAPKSGNGCSTSPEPPEMQGRKSFWHNINEFLAIMKLYCYFLWIKHSRIICCYLQKMLICQSFWNQFTIKSIPLLLHSKTIIEINVKQKTMTEIKWTVKRF